MLWGRHGLPQGMGADTYMIAGADAYPTFTPFTPDRAHLSIQAIPHYDETLPASWVRLVIGFLLFRRARQGRPRSG
jgi:hypothetical protein